MPVLVPADVLDRADADDLREDVPPGRRRRQEQRRRSADVASARELERERQRRHRVCDPQVVPALSRAALTVEGAAMIEVIVEKLRHEQRLSRAGLRRQLRRLSLGEPASVGEESET